MAVRLKLFVKRSLELRFFVLQQGGRRMGTFLYLKIW
ncbi:hypothetical protein B2K_39590 [Paenibacillus mucilaginosus K02]|uniref:Uncharacterized protein n=1 Tax=Paenibacillus mucilaginosus K02 TaxID=997761 RepID=R9ULP4_9BACL|nr:hypothetical protein B2K_39590 [Paenibacillus mucilaginosus K02]